jgi:anti-sigma B factor antagonist
VSELKQTIVDDEHVVVEVRGEIDLRTAPDLGDQLDRAFQDAPAAVIVDLSAATFLDSSGLNVLFNTRRGGQLALVVSDPSLLRTLELTGLNRLAPIAADVKGALALLDDGDATPASA